MHISRYPVKPGLGRIRHRERGVTLAIALIFMVVLTLLSLGMVRSTVSEERMGANTRDYDLAFAAAEAALRDAEIRIQGLYASPVTPITLTSFPTSANSCGTSTSGSTSQIGLCQSITSQPIYTNTTFSLDSTTYAATLGQFTSSPSVQGVATQPHYFIELISIVKTGSSGTYTAYRISAKGYGKNSTTQVMLQEVVMY